MNSPSIGASPSRCSMRSRICRIRSFNDQNHSIGPTLFWNPGGAENDDETAGNGDDDDGAKGKGKEPEPSEMSFSMNVGYQFGLTDATSDGALKFQGSLSF